MEHVQQKRVGGLVYLAFIGLALAVMGGIFVALLWKGYVTAKETRDWAEVPAVIYESKIGERRISRTIPTEYTHELVYHYEFGGKPYRGDRLRRRENPYFKEGAKLEAGLKFWAVGKKVTAWVNPENPEEAVLEHETKAPGYSIWFPCLFLVGGLGVFLRAMLKIFKKG